MTNFREDWIKTVLSRVTQAKVDGRDGRTPDDGHHGIQMLTSSTSFSGELK